ncbi:MAG TPA: cation-translocating P-type ATPase [Candidatus Fournierella merdigallinarum]|nr:cation-translocating P-type ATPase [Candidatus Fournierella merdigallinarum]
MKRLIDRLERLLEWGGIKKDIALLALSGAAVLASLAGFSPLPFDMAWVAILLCGTPILLEAFIGLVTAFDIKADVLVSMALIASVCIGEYFAAGEVAFIMQLGALLEEITVARARAGIEKLVRLTPRTARLLEAGGERVVPADQVRVGQVLRVLPGENVPVDGVILSGRTAIDQSVMTGEPLPVDKAPGDQVSSGTVNQFGAFDMRAARVGEDSSIQRMIRLVQSADAGKAKIVSLADRWATWVVVVALAAALLTWLFTGQIIRAVTILVVFCPCALVLATPTAIMAAIGNATRHGFLVKEGDALERLAGVRVVALDKTGTLTHGAPRVVEAVSVCDSLTNEALFRLAAAAEQLSEHPLGKAIRAGWQEQAGGALPAAEEFSMLPGRGVAALVEGRRVLAGNGALLAEQGVDFAPPAAAAACLDRGCTVTYLAVDGAFAGYIALADTLRPDSRETIRRLGQLGVEPVLLTGDGENAARAIAAQLGVADVRAGCLPQDKLTAIGQLEQAGKPVCMLGDGVNDAPALKRARVGIAMGGVGSDIAVEAADIALVNDEVKELPHLIALSRRMMTTIRLNMTFSMAQNFLAIGLAIPGLLGPVVGALVHNAGSVLVIANSALLLRWKRRAR